MAISSLQEPQGSTWPPFTRAGEYWVMQKGSLKALGGWGGHSQTKSYPSTLQDRNRRIQVKKGKSALKSHWPCSPLSEPFSNSSFCFVPTSFWSSLCDTRAKGTLINSKSDHVTPELRTLQNFPKSGSCIMHFSTKHVNKYLTSMSTPQFLGYNCYSKVKVGSAMIAHPTHTKTQSLHRL